MKKQLYPSDSSNFAPLHWRNPAKGLTVTQTFTCISYVYNMLKWPYTVWRQGDVVDGKDDVIKRCQIHHTFPLRLQWYTDLSDIRSMTCGELALIVSPAADSRTFWNL